jgi:hypothetical protein
MARLVFDAMLTPASASGSLLLFAKTIARFGESDALVHKGTAQGEIGIRRLE